jgi:hypothetical protein
MVAVARGSRRRQLVTTRTHSFVFIIPLLATHIATASAGTRSITNGVFNITY